MPGYIFAIASSLFFSLYIIPRKLSMLTPELFSFLMSFGFFIGTVFIYLVFPSLHLAEQFSPILSWSVVAGLVWAISFVSFVKSIDYLGLARSNQWKNLQGPVGVLLALLILGESAQTSPFLAVIAALFVFASALAFTISNGVDKKVEEKRGVILALFSGLGFGTVAVIQKYVTSNVGVYTQQVVWSWTIFVSLLIYLLFRRSLTSLINHSKKDLLLAFIGGFVYLGASYFQLFSYKYIAASIGFTVIQMNALWTILIGIFVFKEINLKVHYKRVLIGLLCAIVGIIILAFAKR